MIESGFKRINLFFGSNISEGFLTRQQTRVPQMPCLNTRPHSSSSLFCNIVGAIHNDNFSYKGLTWLSAASVSLLSMSCTIHLSWLQFPAGTAIMKTTMVNLNWLKKASKNTAVWFSGGAESKSGRTAVWGDSFAICLIRQRVSDYTPAD